MIRYAAARYALRNTYYIFYAYFNRSAIFFQTKISPEPRLIFVYFVLSHHTFDVQNASSLKSTLTLSPDTISPSIIFSDSISSILLWIARRSGLAP